MLPDRAGSTGVWSRRAWTTTSGLFDRIGMQASLGNPEAVEGFVAFKERRSPSWVHPELRVDGRI